MLFDLKASSMSGDAKSISPTDIAKLKSLLVDIKTSLHEVDPYLGVLTRRESVDPRSAADQKRFDASVAAFRSAIGRLAPYFAPSGLRQKTFTMDEGFDLLESLGLDMKKYQPYKDLTRAGKQLLVGGTPRRHWRRGVGHDYQACRRWLRDLSALPGLYRAAAAHGIRS